MKNLEKSHYRDYLIRYAESTKRRRPGFSMGSWAKALGLKSTSSLTKVLNGEREAGPDLVDKLIQYFKFNRNEELQFRQWVALSKSKESAELKQELAKNLERSFSKKDLKSRLIEIDQYEILSTVFPLAIRELTRIPQMKIARLKKLLPQVAQAEIERALNALARLSLIKRDESGAFVATDDHIHTSQDVPSEAIRTYHENALDQAKKALSEVLPLEREFQSLVLMLNSSELPKVKEKIRTFIGTLESELPQENLDQLYQFQMQLYPISQKERLK